MRQGRKVTEEHSAGGVIYRHMAEGVHLLLIKDAYNNWGLPKGHMEGSEGPKAAALREAQEETGLECRAVGDELMTIDWYFKASGKVIHKYCQFYLMENLSGDPVPERSEGITECRWFPVAEAVKAISYDNAREVLLVALEALEALESGGAEPEGSKP
ncbi:MAG: 8-oxo-dGTP pyrophosphatase MutT (NUDIX family) [Myxococcota bacterium]|jgi:8-oxo-dGTP pyrophosphatase MutT (NUDIX family)